ncbi:hypothetical protein DITRI_Ditri06bG0028800 [Diplodiscus trichospermus]
MVMVNLAITCWVIWKGRCAKVFNNKKPDPQESIAKINALVAEVMNIEEMKRKNYLEKQGKIRARWERPAKEWIKINCDGAICADDENKEGLRSGVGVIVRDENGKVIDGMGRKLRFNSIVEAEAAAIQEGLNLASKI